MWKQRGLAVLLAWRWSTQQTPARSLWKGPLLCSGRALGDRSVKSSWLTWRWWLFSAVCCICVCMYVYFWKCLHACVCVHACEREREREREVHSPHRPIHSPAPFLLLSSGITSGSRQERMWAILKQKGLASILLWLYFLFKKVVVCRHSFVTLSLTVNETLKWLSLLPILMQESFWWWQCSDRYIISLFPHLHTLSPPPSPLSLVSLMVSVDVKHHVYQEDTFRDFWTISKCLNQVKK